MIRNGVHARTLGTQRRMRTQFVDLLVPIVYDKLDSHPSILQYPDVRGVADNLFFCTHDVLEDSEVRPDFAVSSNLYKSWNTIPVFFSILMYGEWRRIFSSARTMF